MKKKIVTTTLFSLVVAGTAFAQLQFRPISVDLTPQGRNSSTSFSVSNSGTEPIAVRLQMLTREIAEDGSEERKAVEKGLFSLFPGSLVLEAGQTRAVRLTWRGPALIDRELAYRILAEQVPVDFSKKTASDATKPQVDIDIYFRYLGAVYVTPDKAEPRIDARAERTGTANQVNIVLENAGTQHAVLHSLRVTLTGSRDGKPLVYEVDPEQLKGISGENMLAGLRRVHPITLPADFPGGPISVEISFETR